MAASSSIDCIDKALGPPAQASSYFICWKFTTVMELLDLQHLRGRADLMVLVSLGA